MEKKNNVSSSTSGWVSQKRRPKTVYSKLVSWLKKHLWISPKTKTIGIKGLLKDVLEKIKGMETAFIYGSFAKNEENAKSDIDLFIIGDTNLRAVVGVLGKLQLKLGREINPVVYTQSEFSQNTDFRINYI